MFGSRINSGQQVREVRVQEAIGKIRSGQAQVVDVREDYEWNNGHVEGAKHIPLGQIPMRAAELDREKEVYTICASGGRSAAAAELLQRGGFANVASVEGGMSSWKSSGYPVVK